MLNDKFVTLISSCLATLVGGTVGIVSAYLTNRWNHRHDQLRQQQEAEQKRTEMLRARGEELYSSAVRWLNTMSAYSLRRGRVMNGELTYNQCLDLDLSDTNVGFDYSRIELLIDVYFPSVKRTYGEVLEQRDELNRIESPFKLAYKQTGAANRSLFDSYIRQMMHLGEIGEKLKKEILQCIRQLEFVNSKD